MFGREPKYIIVPEIDENNEYNNLLDILGCGDKLCTFRDYMEKYYDGEDTFIGVYCSTIKKKDMRVLKFKIQRKLSQKIKKIPLKNPVSDCLTAKTTPFLNWWWKRDFYDFMIYYAAHIEELEKLYDRLEDQESKNTLVEIIRAHSENDVYRLDECKPEDKYWECYRHLDDEKWVNCGSCFGDTIGWYAVFKKYKYDYIEGYEGNSEVFKVLENNINSLNVKNVNLHNEFIGMEKNSADNFDNRYADRDVTLINMDIEGAETPVLRGATELIAKQKPVLAICAYHKPSDIIEIPEIVLEANSDYALYLRKYSPAPGQVTEYVYYFVPRDRKLEA